MNTFYHGDCLFVMNHDIEPESVDLIYLDPPFFTGKIQKGKWRPEAMEVSYEDSKRFWSEKADMMREKAPFWLRHIALKRPDFASYLYYMMVRIEACRGVLNKTGSIYLHCDWRASHYLKMIMDEIFGFEYLKNEIIWCYRLGGRPEQGWPKKHDTILYYTKSNKYTFNADAVRVPYESTGGYISSGRKVVKGKEYFVNPLGKVPEDWWFISALNRQSKERMGYPTQKPEALLERIIKASSNEGDVVLDPFCGCGTAIIAAHGLNRRWIGIDINKSAYDVTKGREVQMPLGMQQEFAKAKYVPRDLAEVEQLNPREFEAWVNEFYKATKPQPDRGVDGITQDGSPIQSKAYVIKYDKLSQFINDAKYHSLVPKPIKKVIAVSQRGFDDSAKKLQFQVQTREPIEVELITPKQMLEIQS